MNEPKYPDAVVRLVGESTNTGAIMGRVVEAMREVGADRADIDTFRTEAFSGSYQEFIQSIFRWVTVEDPEEEYDD